MKWNVLRSQKAFRSPVFDVRTDYSRAESNGLEHEFQIVEARDWVNVIPLTPDDQVVLVRQYRHGIRDFTLEVPAGVIDPEDASPRVAAERELREETGYAARRLESLGVVHPNPAIMNNSCHVFVAHAAQQVGLPQWDQTEEMSIEMHRLDTIVDLIRKGAISNALTIVAFQLLQLRCDT